MKQLFALLSGVVFGLGLILSGMSDPAKVLNFLDVFGTFDPSLALVMGGAIAVAGPGLALLTARRSAPLFDTRFRIPTRRDIDARLLGGAVIFGVGWGIGGFCPGPALTALPLAAPGTLAFLPCMLAGMWLARHVPTLSATAAKGTA